MPNTEGQYNEYGAWYGHQQQDVYQQHEWYPTQHQQEMQYSPTHQDFYNAAMYMGLGGFPQSPPTIPSLLHQGGLLGGLNMNPGSLGGLTGGLNIPGSLPGSLPSSYPGSYAGSLPPSLPGSFPPSPALQGAFAPPLPPPYNAHGPHPGTFAPQPQAGFAAQIAAATEISERPLSQLQPAMYTQPPRAQVPPPTNKENVVPPPKNVQKSKDSKDAVKPEQVQNKPQVIPALNQRAQVL